MLEETKKFIRSVRSGTPSVLAHDVGPARDYIEKYWKHLYRDRPDENSTLIKLPHPYLVPASEPGKEFEFNEQYYWDSYFIVQGMMDEDHKKLVIGMLDNLVFLFKHFGIIPNASRTYFMGHSQPPFLTSFIMDVYDAYDMSSAWLKEHMAVAEEEYHMVWMGIAKPNARQVYEGLSRNYDINVLHDIAETESGWDMTNRFGRKCLNYLPVDLNSLLYKYETDFARTAGILGDEDRQKEWLRAAHLRKATMDRLMWDRIQGLYRDFNYVKKRRSLVNSLATYYPLWAGMVDGKQAKMLVGNLRRFEHRGGLSTTELPPINKLAPGSMPIQWAYPNGWAPLQYIAIRGLQRYGFDEEAERIAKKWLRTNLTWFEKHGNFLEKYNVVNPSKPPVKGVYPAQTGFGWTNAVFERFCKDFIDK